MVDESDFKDYKTLEEYMETLEGSKYYHGLLMRTVIHPIRREILKIVNESKRISKSNLFSRLKEDKIVDDENVFNYNLDYLIKALCINVLTDDNGQIHYEITQSGKVIDWI